MTTELQQLDIFSAIAQAQAEAETQRKLPVRDRFKVGDFVQGRFQKGDPIKRGWLESFTMSELLLIRQQTGKQTMISPEFSEVLDAPAQAEAEAEFKALVGESAVAPKPEPAPSTLEQRLKERGFREINHAGFEGGDYELHQYRDWTIGLWIPNGGIVAVDIAKGDRVWGKQTEQEFNHHDSDGIRQFAQATIDQAEFGLRVGDRITYTITIPGKEARTLRGTIEGFEDQHWTAPVALVRIHPTGPLYPCGLRAVTLEGDRDV